MNLTCDSCKRLISGQKYRVRIDLVGPTYENPTTNRRKEERYRDRTLCATCVSYVARIMEKPVWGEEYEAGWEKTP